MGAKSEIQWTDATWNPITGCTQVSPGCDHCYAMELHNRRYRAWQAGWEAAPAQYHQPFSTVQVMEDRLTLPLHWRTPRRIFVNSMSDLFHKDVPDNFIFKMFGVMADAKQHTFQILTKRPKRMLNLMSEWKAMRWQFGASGRWLPLPNVWLGTSIEADRYSFRAWYLAQTPAAVRFISAEPFLEGVPSLSLAGIHWVICGGESGAGYRPLDLDAVRALRDRCVDAGVAFFFKQVGGHTPKAGGRLLDGREWNEMPA